MCEEANFIRETIESYKLAVKSMYAIAKGLKPKDAKPYIDSAMIFEDVIRELEDDLSKYMQESVIDELERKILELQEELRELKNNTNGKR